LILRRAVSGHVRLANWGKYVTVLVLADELGRGLDRFSDLEQRVLRVSTTSLTFLAEVCVTTDRAHVAQAFDGVHTATVADDTLVNSLILILSLLFNMLGEHLLEGGVTVLLDFLADHSSNCREFLRNKSTSSVALATRKSFLVHLRSVALDAGNFFKFLITLFIRREEKVASDVTILDLNLHLDSLIVHRCAHAIAALVTHFRHYLRGHLFGVDACVNHLLSGPYSLSVATGIKAASIRHAFSTDRDAGLDRLIGTDGNLMTGLVWVVHHGVAAIQHALTELLVADGIEVGVSQKVVSHWLTSGEACTNVVLAHNS